MGHCLTKGAHKDSGNDQAASSVGRSSNTDGLKGAEEKPISEKNEIDASSIVISVPPSDITAPSSTAPLSSPLPTTNPPPINNPPLSSSDSVDDDEEDEGLRDLIPNIRDVLPANMVLNLNDFVVPNRNRSGALQNSSRPSSAEPVAGEVGVELLIEENVDDVNDDKEEEKDEIKDIAPSAVTASSSPSPPPAPSPTGNNKLQYPRVAPRHHRLHNDNINDPPAGALSSRARAEGLLEKLHISSAGQLTLSVHQLAALSESGVLEVKDADEIKQLTAKKRQEALANEHPINDELFQPQHQSQIHSSHQQNPSISHNDPVQSTNIVASVKHHPHSSVPSIRPINVDSPRLNEESQTASKRTITVIASGTLKLSKAGAARLDELLDKHIEAQNEKERAMEKIELEKEKKTATMTNNNNEPPPSNSSTPLNPSQTLSSPLPSPSPSPSLPLPSPSPNLHGIQERLESSAVRLTNFRIELPDCGIRLHIEGTKEKNMTVQSALINVQGAAFWDSLLIRQSWPVRMAIKVARKNLPVQLCPHLMNPAAFIRGSTTFSTTIDLGTDGKGVNSKLTRERISHKLNKLANVRGNPSLSFVVRLGGILGPVETAKMELERKNAKAAAAEKKKEKKDGEDDADEAFDESLIGPLMFYFTTTPKQLVQSLNAKS